MKKILFSVLGVAILALIGCGGGGTKEVKKDAAFYKEEFRKGTSIKVLNTDERVLFTMKSLRDSFLQSFDVNGTNEGINRDIINQFKSNLLRSLHNEESIDFKNVEINEITPILLASISAKNKGDAGIETKLKEAVKEVCDSCQENDVNQWFIDHQSSLEKSMEENSEVDEDNDKQVYIDETPPPYAIIVCCQPDIPINFNDHHFFEIQTLRAVYNSDVDREMP